MTEHPVTIRLPSDLLSRLDALVPHVASDSNTAAMLGGVTRSSVIRYALLEGVKRLEKRHGEQ